MFPETKSRETLRVEGKQNSLFSEGADIKCFVIQEQTYFTQRFYFMFRTFHNVAMVRKCN